MRKPLFIAMADTHIKSATPSSRTDDYLQAVSNKLKFISDYADSLDVPILHSGDIFDKYNPSCEAISAVIDNLKPNKKVYLIAGNHCLKFHNYDLIDKTGVYILGTHQNFKLLSPYEVPDTGNFLVAGMPFGFYSLKDGMFAGFPINKPRVGLIHILTYDSKDGIPFVGCTANSIQKLSTKYPMLRCLVTGDNHTPFVYENEHTLCINPGSTARLNIAQRYYQPQIYVVYDDFTWSTVDIPVVKEVFDEEQIDNKKEKEDKIASFVASINNEIEVGLSFEKNLKQKIAVSNPKQPVIDEIEKAVNKQ